jgi:hypothetical protein
MGDEKVMNDNAMKRARMSKTDEVTQEEDGREADQSKLLMRGMKSTEFADRRREGEGKD